ncbi:hypothetical protein [Sediminibacterium sp.]|uniref:hypothetical protein n=1 Tax=Sediminibacterium sp. TaxID=1917865 RepID=UPI0025FAB34D|nr:hypothetical protein [Sediminibacterium sp.]MBT9485066.1 hypothetical protein [Sediminibacterium sp.]
MSVIEKGCMHLKILFTLNLFLLLLNPIQAQDSKKYREEKAKVLQFFQDSILSNQRYFPKNSQSDTIFIRNYLSNHELFVQLKSNLLNPEYIPKDLQPPNTIKFSEKELAYILNKTQLDTVREALGFLFNENSKVIGHNPKSIEISKPVFLRNYTMCFISFKNVNRKREIFGPVYNLLLVNRNGKWGIANNSIDLMANYIDDDDL